MFAPEGYVTARRIHIDLVAAIRSAECTDDVRAAGLRTRYDPATGEEDNSFNAATINLVEYLRSLREVKVFTREGLLVSLDTDALAPKNTSSKLEFVGLWIVDLDTWCLDFSRAADWLEDGDRILSTVRTEYRVRKGLGADVEVHGAHLNRIWQARWMAGLLLRSFKHLEGASIVVERSKTPSLSQLLAPPETESKDSGASAGRPSIQAQVKRAYDIAFPSGHGGHRWKEIQAAIEEECGIPASVDTIKRAIGLRTG